MSKYIKHFLILVFGFMLFAGYSSAHENHEGASHPENNPVLDEIKLMLIEQQNPAEISTLEEAQIYLLENLRIMMGYLIILERDIEGSELTDDYKNDLKESLDERLDELEVFRADIEFAENQSDIALVAQRMFDYWEDEKRFMKIRYAEYYHAKSKQVHTQLKSIKSEATNINEEKRSLGTSATKHLEEATIRLDNANESNKAASNLLDDLEELEDKDALNIKFEQAIKNLEIASRFISEGYTFLVEAVTDLRR